VKSLVPILCALTLAGCAGVNDRSYGSWLGAMGRPVARGDISADGAKELAAQVQSLQKQAETIRVRMAHESDRVKRVEYLRELQAIGDQLRPLQQALLQGGFAPPTPLAGPLAPA
jgi:hypothetical protein